MKKIILLLLAVIAFGNVASAQPSPYDLKGRYHKQTGVYLAPKILYSVKQEAKGIGSDDDSVMGGGIAVGYNFYSRDDLFPVRVEAEYMMRERASLEYDGYSHRYGVDTMMLNAAVGINTGTKFTPYITGGIGYGFIDGEISQSGVKTDIDNEAFVYSFGVDLTFSVNSNILLGLEYRYSDFGSSDMETSLAKEQDLTAQEVIFALRYKF